MFNLLAKRYLRLGARQNIQKKRAEIKATSTLFSKNY
jgi:hypothetical protein